MAKKRKTYRKQVTSSTTDVEVTLSTGVTVRCFPIVATLDAIRNTVPLPDKPTYTMTDVAKAKIDIEYDQAAIDDENTPPEDKKAWTHYLQEAQKAQAERSHRIYSRIARRGIKVIGGGMSKSEFIEELEADGITPPENKHAFNLLYTQLEVIATPDDFQAVMIGISVASGVDPERIAAAESKIFRPVGKLDGEDAGTDSGDAQEGQEPQA